MYDELKDVCTTLLITMAEHKDESKLKTSARIIGNRVKNKESYDFLYWLQRSPAPLRQLLKVIKEKGYDDTLSIAAAG